jgi:hypothetical protein
MGKATVITAFLSLFLIMSADVLSFEIDGFRSGATQDVVTKTFMDRNFSLEEIDTAAEGTLILANGDIRREYAFVFCKGRLVGLSKLLKPSMKNFIVMSEKVIDTHGKPFDMRADTRFDSFIETNSILLRWMTKEEETVSLIYLTSPARDQFSIEYSIRSTCF